MTAETYTHEYAVDGGGGVPNMHLLTKDEMGGKLIIPPLDLSGSPLRILDSGTSDGAWIQDVAGEWPQHQFVGTDLKPDDFPKTPPANTVYQVQDITSPWPEEWKGSFDFVHQRMVSVGAGAKQKEAVQSLAALVKPGGWIQLAEATNEAPESAGPFMRDTIQTMRDIFVFMGADIHVTDKLGGWLEEVGFVDVQTRELCNRIGAAHPDAQLAKEGVFYITTSMKMLAALGKSTYLCAAVSVIVLHFC